MCNPNKVMPIILVQEIKFMHNIKFRLFFDKRKDNNSSKSKKIERSRQNGQKGQKKSKWKYQTLEISEHF